MTRTWMARGGGTRHLVDGRRACEDEGTLSYAIGLGRDIGGNPVSVLEFDRDVLLGPVGQRFAPQLGDIYEGDPTIASMLSLGGA